MAPIWAGPCLVLRVRLEDGASRNIVPIERSEALVAVLVRGCLVWPESGNSLEDVVDAWTDPFTGVKR